MAYALNAADISLKNKNVVILGTGGTSLMAQTLAKEAGAKSITVVSRSGDRNYENVYDLNNTEVIVNCTPVGMFPHNGEKIVDLSRFPALSGVFDAVSGVLVGKPMDETYEKEYHAQLIRVIGNPRLPVLCNVNIGHAQPRCILPLGREATVDAEKQTIRFAE